MAIYIDKDMVSDIDNIPSEVFKYLIKKHQAELGRYQKLYDYYIGRHKIFIQDADDTEKIRVNSNYAKYTTDIALGYYLGEPVKYNGSSDKKKKISLNNGVEAAVKNGSVRLYDESDSGKADISRYLDILNNQTISEIDAKIGKYIGIFGSTYELEYANGEEHPEPRSAVYDPRNVIMVRDNTVEHNKLFTIIYEIQEDLTEHKYFSVTVYTDHNSKQYKSNDLNNFIFNEIPESEKEHYFGEVPVVEYQNNDERQGDYEQVIPLIDGLNELLSDRVTDKKKFVNSLLALYGITLEEDDIKILAKERFLDGIPLDAKIEYIQKVFEESSMNILCNDIIREIHKMTLTVDMTDENFAGNSSGQALMLKLMTMNMLVKNKMRSFEKGLKKRFQMYNTWLSTKGEMPQIDKNELDVVFTVSMPVDKQQVVQMIVQLQDIVDDKTLLSQLWFIKDVDEVLAAVKKQKEEKQKQYMDSFKENGDTENLNNYEEENDEQVINHGKVLGKQTDRTGKADTGQNR
ncbi:MAG: phage portal protein [Lachnospiraceae bacterium]|nr:phage portal protein [Lachnospiraceae bacterium]